MCIFNRTICSDKKYACRTGGIVWDGNNYYFRLQLVYQKYAQTTILATRNRNADYLHRRVNHIVYYWRAGKIYTGDYYIKNTPQRTIKRRVDFLLSGPWSWLLL